MDHQQLLCCFFRILRCYITGACHLMKRLVLIRIPYFMIEVTRFHLNCWISYYCKPELRHTMGYLKTTVHRKGIWSTFVLCIWFNKRRRDNLRPFPWLATWLVDILSESCPSNASTGIEGLLFCVQVNIEELFVLQFVA